MDDFKVFTRDETTGQITLTPPSPPQRASGFDKLIQIVFLALLNDPGRNVFHPDDGSGFPSMVGSNIDPDDPMETLAEASERVEKIKEEIIEGQSVLENEDPSELLKDLSVLSAETGINIDRVLLKLRLVSEADDETDLSV